MVDIDSEKLLDWIVVARSLKMSDHDIIEHVKEILKNVASQSRQVSSAPAPSPQRTTAPTSPVTPAPAPTPAPGKKEKTQRPAETPRPPKAEKKAHNWRNALSIFAQ